MATNHTTNYQLSQWEPSDQVLRTDFNADNAKIDAVMHSIQTTSVEGLAAVAATVPKVAFGSYNGDGKASQYIPLDFEPKAVLLLTAWGWVTWDDTCCGGLALAGKPVISRDTRETVLSISGKGFYAYYQAGGSDFISANDSRWQYHYLALG